MEKIRWHHEKGDKVVIVSASIECWLSKWCKKHNIDLIATRLETRKGKLTGKFTTKNCYGIEKVNRIKEQYNLGSCPRMPFCPNSSELSKNNSRNITYMAALIFGKFFDFEQNVYSRTSS